MKKQGTVFDFLGQVFLLFGILVLMLIVMSLLIGNDVRNDSVMFSLGDNGLSIQTLLQFLLVSLMNNGLRSIFFTDRLIKDAPNSVRTMGMLGSILIFMSLMIYIFKWFPMNSVVPWILFLVFFIISFGISVLVVFWKEKLENKKMEEGLNKLKAQLEEGTDGTHH